MKNIILIAKSDLYKGYYSVGKILEYKDGTVSFYPYTHCEMLETAIKNAKDFNKYTKENNNVYLYDGVIKVGYKERIPKEVIEKFRNINDKVVD